MLAITSPHKRGYGFTLIELLVVIALVAVMASLAAPSFQVGIAKQKVGSATSDLMASLMQARSEAITNNQQTIVESLDLDTSDWSKGWLVYVDTDKDKSYTEGTDILVSKVKRDETNVVINDASIGNLVGFQATGFLLGQSAGRIVFASSSVPSTEFKKGVKISRVGRIRICTSTTANDGCAGED